MKHIHKPGNTMAFRVCKKGHGATHQRYCTECGKLFCNKCQAERQDKAKGISNISAQQAEIENESR